MPTDWVIVDEYLPTCYAHLHAVDGTLLSTLDNGFGLSWQDPFNDAGSGTITMPFDDPDAALMTIGCTVRCFVYDELAFSWLIEKEPSMTVVTDGEESAMVVTADGPGLVAILADCVVYPFKGTASQFVSQHRLYTFASPDYPNDGDWTDAWQFQEQRYIDPVRHDVIELTTEIPGEEAEVELIDGAAPLGWLVPDAHWIWAQEDTYEVGRCYFRTTFTLSVGTQLIIAATGDNWWTLYLDGTPLIGDQGDGGGWKEYRSADLNLPAGTYQLGAVVENALPPDDTPYSNPAGFLCAVYTVDEDDKLATVIRMSDNTWKALAYPSITPGWTPGQIIIDQIHEAQDRGQLAGLTWDFTDWGDTNGNSWEGETGPWSYVPGFSIPIGGTVFDVLGALVDQGWIQYRMTPGGVLQVFNQGTQFWPGVVLEQTGDTATQNLVDLEFAAQEKPTTSLLVKWAEGFVEVEDADASAAYGRREGFVSIDGATIEEVYRQAVLTLAEVARPRTAIVAEIEAQSDLDKAYLSWHSGDVLTCPNRVGEMQGQVVQSISVDQTDMGEARVVVELGARLLARERENLKLLQTLGRGVTGSTKIRNGLNETSGWAHG